MKSEPGLFVGNNRNSARLPHCKFSLTCVKSCCRRVDGSVPVPFCIDSSSRCTSSSISSDCGFAVSSFELSLRANFCGYMNRACFTMGKRDFCVSTKMKSGMKERLLNRDIRLVSLPTKQMPVFTTI